MRLPRVDPVGVLHVPEELSGRPRPHRPAARALAAVLLAVFLVVAVATSAVSLGAYCLTTDTADTRALPRR